MGIKQTPQRGDTIVEVLIAVAIVSTVLVGAFMVTQRSAAAVRDSQEHAEALQVLQGQVELVRSLALKEVDNSSGVYRTTPSKYFCIDETTKDRADFHPSFNNLPELKNDNFDDYNAACKDRNPRYNLAVTYNDATEVFTFTGRWDGLGSVKRQVQLSYRIYPGGAIVQVTPPIEIPDPSDPLPENPTVDPFCKYYAVHDEDNEDSQFVKIDPYSRTVTNFGPLLNNYDFEGLDIHPVTNVLYAVRGTSQNVDGRPNGLYIINPITGAPTYVGPTGRTELPALAFHPNGTLWSWSEGEGLVTINIATGAASPVKASSIEMEAMAWNNDGSVLYLSKGDDLYTYNPVTNNAPVRVINDRLPPTEALEMRPDGLLLGGVNEQDATDETQIYLLDPISRTVLGSVVVASLFADLESIAYPQSCPSPPVN